MKKSEKDKLIKDIKEFDLHKNRLSPFEAENALLQILKPLLHTSCILLFSETLPGKERSPVVKLPQENQLVFGIGIDAWGSNQ